MGTRTSYAPGAFCWVELATDDVAAAAAFYGALLGWTTQERGAAVECRIGGALVCELRERPEAGAAPAWTSHVSVEDADAAAVRAQELGGAVLRPPADVTGGRVALLADPEGAALAVWQPRGRIGAEHVNDAGCLCMNELVTADLGAARAFYEGLFGWTTEAVAAARDAPIGVALNGPSVNAGFFAAGPGTRAHWRPCFTVAATEAAVAHATELGATEVVAPLDFPEGGLAVLRDPQGAPFAVFAGEVDP